MTAPAWLPASPTEIHFRAYSGEELAAIFTQRAHDAGYTLGGGAKDKAGLVLAQAANRPRTGNARQRSGCSTRPQPARPAG